MKAVAKTTQFQTTEQITQNLFQSSVTNKYEVLRALKASERGLDFVDIESRRETFGFNEFDYERPLPWTIQLLRAFINPFSLILLALAAISFLTEVVLEAPQDRNPAAVIVILSLIAVKWHPAVRAGAPVAAGSGQAQGNGQDNHHRPAPRRRTRRAADQGTCARRHLPDRRWRHDPGRSSGAGRKGPLRQPVCHDRRIRAGREARR